jgi:hypothetical protein
MTKSLSDVRLGICLLTGKCALSQEIMTYKAMVLSVFGFIRKRYYVKTRAFG